MKAPYYTSSHVRHVLVRLRGFNFSRPYRNSITILSPSYCNNSISLSSSFKPNQRLVRRSASGSSESISSDAGPANRIGSSEAAEVTNDEFVGVKDEAAAQGGWRVEVGNPRLPIPSVAKLSFSDQAFFLLAFIACTVFVFGF